MSRTESGTFSSIADHGVTHFYYLRSISLIIYYSKIIFLLLTYLKNLFRPLLQFNVQSVKKKQNTPIYFKIIYRTEMKLVPIIMDYCLLQFDALKFLLGVRLLGGLYLALIFSM